MTLKMVAFVGRIVVRPVYDFGQWLTAKYIDIYKIVYARQYKQT